jgi:hypothetical protein
MEYVVVVTFDFNFSDNLRRILGEKVNYGRLQYVPILDISISIYLGTLQPDQLIIIIGCFSQGCVEIKDYIK